MTQGSARDATFTKKAITTLRASAGASTERNWHSVDGQLRCGHANPSRDLCLRDLMDPPAASLLRRGQQLDATAFTMLVTEGHCKPGSSLAARCRERMDLHAKSQSDLLRRFPCLEFPFRLTAEREQVGSVSTMNRSLQCCMCFDSFITHPCSRISSAATRRGQSLITVMTAEKSVQNPTTRKLE
eukprot:CAMPEP_0204311122 /NCGR_PEP_ID=MMETSP0469-20131031/2146_1 /ASSEMBLY_ACC=CAM_ASM_000384 /TAXON_ID=2969 /ORGANISM="Oxyrrhis marina" /LENGTH=184 /DNA_ID=CAMNT_0051291019 /DNA_START=287 /DNA_END=839 /DNA_ORIENTATION=+